MAHNSLSAFIFPLTFFVLNSLVQHSWWANGFLDFYPMTWQLSFHSLNSFQAVTHSHSNFYDRNPLVSCIISKSVVSVPLPKKKNPSLILSHFTFKMFILYLWTVQSCGMQIIKSKWRLLKSWESSERLSISFQAGFTYKCNFLVRNPSPFVFSIPPILLS